MLTDEALEAWNNRRDPAVLTTVSPEGVANSVWIGVMQLLDRGRIAIADSAFSKTRENIQAGSRGVFLFLSNDFKAFQVKGRISYHQDDEVFAEMLNWNTSQWRDDAVGVAVVHVEELYCGAERLV